LSANSIAAATDAEAAAAVHMLKGVWFLLCSAITMLAFYLLNTGWSKKVDT